MNTVTLRDAIRRIEDSRRPPYVIYDRTWDLIRVYSLPGTWFRTYLLNRCKAMRFDKMTEYQVTNQLAYDILCHEVKTIDYLDYQHNTGMQECLERRRTLQEMNT